MNIDKNDLDMILMQSLQSQLKIQKVKLDCLNSINDGDLNPTRLVIMATISEIENQIKKLLAFPH